MNTLILEDMESIPSCDNCGSCFETQEDIDQLVYSRTTAMDDHYICPDCKREGINIPSKENEDA